MSSASTIFLTGGTGFIGTRLARMLIRRGERVRCLVRNPATAGTLAQMGVQLIPGDITDPLAIGRGLAGANAAIHLAAVYDIGVVNEAAMERTNVAGTAAFLDAVQTAGTPRVIHVSTTVALGPVAMGTGDEATRNHGPYGSVYERTKTEAHELARAAQDRGLPVIIACPAYVYGPGDTGPGARFLRDLIHSRVPGLLTRPAWFSFVHVDDVVDGLIAVLDRGSTGDSYVLSGDDTTINAFAERAASLAGVRAPFLRFPPPLAHATGRLLDTVTRLTGARFPITAENVRTVSGHRWLHSHAKATTELGWQPRTLDDGLPETVASLRNG